MRITESGLRRIVRRALREAADPATGAVAFFMDGSRAPVELADPTELLPLLLAAESRHPRLAFVVEGLEAAGLSFELIGRPPPDWEGMWWWPLPAEDARPDSNSVRAPRYHSMLDAAAASLRERQGESLHVFGAGPGLPGVKIQVGPAWEDTDLLPAGFSRGWWGDLVGGLRPERRPVEWLGSDDPMTR